MTTRTSHSDNSRSLADTRSFSLVALAIAAIAMVLWRADIYWQYAFHGDVSVPPNIGDIGEGTLYFPTPWWFVGKSLFLFTHLLLIPLLLVSAVAVALRVQRAAIVLFTSILNLLWPSYFAALYVILGVFGYREDIGNPEAWMAQNHVPAWDIWAQLVFFAALLCFCVLAGRLFLKFPISIRRFTRKGQILLSCFIMSVNTIWLLLWLCGVVDLWYGAGRFSEIPNIDIWWVYPTCVAAVVGLKKNHPWAYILSVVVLFKDATYACVGLMFQNTEGYMYIHSLALILGIEIMGSLSYFVAIIRRIEKRTRVKR